MKDTLIRLQIIVSKQLGINPDRVKLEADFSKDLGADSLDVVELVMGIEDEFDLEIDDQIASQITTVHDALIYIEEQYTK